MHICYPGGFMSLLLTGATGLVGRLLLDQTGEREVLAITRRPCYTLAGVRVIQADLADPSFSLAIHAGKMGDCALRGRRAMRPALGRSANDQHPGHGAVAGFGPASATSRVA